MDVDIPSYKPKRCQLLLAPILRLRHHAQVRLAVVLWIPVLVVDVFTADLAFSDSGLDLPTRFVARRTVVDLLGLTMVRIVLLTVVPRFVHLYLKDGGGEPSSELTP